MQHDRILGSDPRISAEMEAEKSLIIVDGPAHEVVAIGDSVCRLDCGREGVHRDDISRDIHQMAKIAASLGRPCPSVWVSIAFTWVEHEPDGGSLGVRLCFRQPRGQALFLVFHPRRETKNKV